MYVNRGLKKLTENTFIKAHLLDARNDVVRIFYCDGEFSKRV